jgi:hypothetical protein
MYFMSVSDSDYATLISGIVADFLWKQKIFFQQTNLFVFLAKNLLQK